MKDGNGCAVFRFSLPANAVGLYQIVDKRLPFMDPLIALITTRAATARKKLAGTDALRGTYHIN